MPTNVQGPTIDGDGAGSAPSTASIQSALGFITEFNENVLLFGQLVELILQVDANALIANISAARNSNEIAHLKGAFARLTDRVHSLGDIGRAEQAWKNDPRRKATNPSGQGRDILID